MENKQFRRNYFLRRNRHIEQHLLAIANDGHQHTVDLLVDRQTRPETDRTKEGHLPSAVCFQSKEWSKIVLLHNLIIGFHRRHLYTYVYIYIAWISYRSRSPSRTPLRRCARTLSRLAEQPAQCPPFAATTTASTVSIITSNRRLFNPFQNENLCRVNNLLFIHSQCIYKCRRQASAPPICSSCSISARRRPLVRGTSKSPCCRADPHYSVHI